MHRSGRSRWRSTSTSEANPQREIDRSRRAGAFQVIRVRAGDLGRGIGRTDVTSRIGEAGVIEGIGEYSLELYLQALMNREIFQQGQVDVLHRRPLQDIDSGVTKPSDAGWVVADRVAIGTTRDFKSS